MDASVRMKVALARRSLTAACVLVALAWPGAWAGSAAEQPFVVSQPVLYLPTGGGTAEIEIDVKAPAAAASKTTADPIVDDVADPKSEPKVAFVAARPGSPAAVGRMRWRIRAVVTGLPAQASTTVRQLTIAWNGAKSEPLRYWVTTLPTPALTWKIRGVPAEWSIRDETCLPVTVVSPRRISAIRLDSNLVDDVTKQPMAASLYLATDDVRASSREASDLAAAVNAGQPVRLCAAPMQGTAGKFVGDLTVSAPEDAEGVSAKVAIQVSSSRATAIGTVLILLGALLAYVARVALPSRQARERALLPAADLRDRARLTGLALDDAVKGLQLAAPNARAQLKGLQDDLSERVLDARGLIPGRIASAFGVSGDVAKYAEHLKATADRFARLDVLVRAGWIPLARMAPARPAAETAAAALEAVVPRLDATTLDELRANVQAILSAASATFAVAMEAAPPRAVSEAQTRVFQLERINLLAWAVSIVVTVLAGAIVLILRNQAFGQGLDYAYCVAWGIGLPTAVTQLTGDSVRQVLGLTLPKTT